MKQNKNQKIRITIGKTELMAVLDGTQTSQDFLSLLPLELKMNDLFGREKYGKLPRSISKEGKQIQRYEIGDIAYWTAGPDVAIYYRQDGERIESGLYKIGHIEGGVEAFNVPGSVNVKITAINSNTKSE